MSILKSLFKGRTEARPEGPPINHVDVGFVVDTTGSMGTFINAARQRLLEVVDALSQRSALDLQLGLVEYRDHPPQDQSFVRRVNQLTADRQAVQKVIAGLTPNGGGDGPEAVFDGVHAACTELGWRTGSARLVVLVGDAPPHGVGAPGDGFAKGCPCGLDTDRVTAAAEEARVTVHAVCMSADQHARRAFGQLAAGTGGVVVDATDASKVIERLGARLEADFADLAFDRRVLDEVTGRRTLEPAPLAEALGAGRLVVAAALSRLGRRGLLDGLEA